MYKITFIGAGSSVFAKNLLGDCMCSDILKSSEFALYDIDGTKLKESEEIIGGINQMKGLQAKISTYLGVENRKAALKGAHFVINAIQVGGYDPCTIIDFEVPQKYGLRQTIGDTLGIGGIMRGLRTIPIMEEIARDIQEMCPDAWLLNYVNPMSIITGYIQRYTGIKTVGICHSVQVCSEHLLRDLGMEDKIAGRKELIAGINHMGWLLKIQDKNGTDLYPEMKRRAKEKNQNEKHADMVRYDYMEKLGFYCTESSEHNAEYNPFYIKRAYPELIDRFKIPIDEYPRRCVEQIKGWQELRNEIISNGLTHERTSEYASYIIEAMVKNEAYVFGGNVINRGLIENLPADACVEVPCVADGMGVHPCHVGRLPVQLAAMNMTNVNVHSITIEAAVTRKKEHIYQAAMLDPHTAAELSLDDIIKMTDELIAAHGKWLPAFH